MPSIDDGQTVICSSNICLLSFNYFPKDDDYDHLTFLHVTPFHQRFILSTFLTIYIFALPNRRFDTQFLQIRGLLLKVQLLQSVYFLLFSLFCSSSQIQLCRNDVPFVVMGHICSCSKFLSPCIRSQKRVLARRVRTLSETL